MTIIETAAQRARAVAAACGRTLTRLPWRELTTRRGWAIVLLVAWIGLHAPDVAYAIGGKPTIPTGFANAFQPPDLAKGQAPTLFEATENGNSAIWSIDTNVGGGIFGSTGWDGTLAATMNGLMVIPWELSLAGSRDLVSLTAWVLTLGDLDVLSDTISGGIGRFANSLTGWLLPSAVAIGGLVAWAKRKSGEGINQIIWLIVSGVMALTFALAPNVWVDGINTARQVGSDAAMSNASAAVSADQTEPIAQDPPAAFATGSTETDRDSMIRKSTDAIWRGTTATPWCLANFGSIEACKAYGPDILAKGADKAARYDYIREDMRNQEGGDDQSPTMSWVYGFQWGQRGAVVVGSMIVNLALEIVLFVLLFGTVAALASSLLHLAVGPFFAILWTIPGTPRRIGLQWLESLIGTVIQGVLTLLVFVATLLLVTACYSSMGQWGMVPTLVIALTIVISALKFRDQIGGWFGYAGPGEGSAIVGAMAIRGASRMFSKGGNKLAGAANRENAAGRATGKAGRATLAGGRVAGRVGLAGGRAAGRGFATVSRRAGTAAAQGAGKAGRRVGAAASHQVGQARARWNDAMRDPAPRPADGPAGTRPIPTSEGTTRTAPRSSTPRHSTAPAARSSSTSQAPARRNGSSATGPQPSARRQEALRRAAGNRRPVAATPFHVAPTRVNQPRLAQAATTGSPAPRQTPSAVPAARTSPSRPEAPRTVASPRPTTPAAPSTAVPHRVGRPSQRLAAQRGQAAAQAAATRRAGSTRAAQRPGRRK